jgi:hypothetical protein
MSIQVVWDNAEKTIVRMDFGTWGWADVHAALKELATLSMDLVGTSIPVIVNLEHANAMPLVGAITNLRYIFIESETPYLFILVAVKPIGKVVLKMLSDIHPPLKQKVLLVNTLAEARALTVNTSK